MNFTCSGTVTGWKAAGVIRTQNDQATTNSVLSIWRETGSGSGTQYDRVEEIELGICDGQDLVSETSNIYECTLPQAVSVQPGYVVGIQLPQERTSKFRLYFNSQGGQTNHVFNGHGSHFSQSQAISSEQTTDQPQISLTFVPTVLPTTQPPTMTEASSTMADLPTTTSLPLTFTSMATTEPPTSTEASTTMAAATDPPATTIGSPATDTAAVTTSINSESTAAGSTTTEIPSSATIDAQTPRGSEAVQQRESNTGTIAGAAVGAIIAVLLVLIIVLLLVLVLRRQTRNGQKFTPSNNATIVNPVYDGKPIVPNLEGVFH
jgi:hypothetical protein